MTPLSSKDSDYCNGAEFTLWRSQGVKVRWNRYMKALHHSFSLYFTVQFNDLHHWVPKQPASVSRQGWLRITLWNDIKLVKHFSAYRIGQRVPYSNPASNSSPFLSYFLQFSWGESSMQPLQRRLVFHEKTGRTIQWSHTWHSSSAPLSWEQIRNIIFRCFSSFFIF